MRTTILFGAVFALGCGGGDSTTDGGGGDGSMDATVNDTGVNDTGVNDTGNNNEGGNEAGALGSVNCGMAMCNVPMETCCYRVGAGVDGGTLLDAGPDGGANPQCTAPGQCQGVRFSCDEKSDCPMAEVCC